MRLLSPVFFKELGQIAVSRRFFWLELFVLCLLLLDFGIMFIDPPSSSSALSRMASIGKALFWSMTWIQAIALLIFVPAVTAGVVCGEKESNTLGLLFLTRLRAWQIVQDKGLSRVVFMGFLCLVTLPFMIAALLFGGVEMREVVMAFATLLSIILLAAGFAMLCSTLLGKYVAALATTYATLLLYLLVMPIGIGFLINTILPSRPFEYVSFINPFVSLAVAAEEYAIRSHPILRYAWVGNLSVSLVIYAFAVLVASLVLRRVAFADGHYSGFAPGRRVWRLGVARLAASCLQRGSTVGAHPVLWKESNLIHDNLRRVLINLVEVFFVVWLALMALVAFHQFNDLAQNDIYLIAHAISVFIILLFMGILAAASFTRERESGALDILLSTRLKGSDIVYQTFFGLVRVALPMLLPVVLILMTGYLLTACKPVVFFLFPITTVSEYNSITPWASLLNLVVFPFFVLVVGLCMSLWQRTTARAVGWTMFALLGLGVGVPFLYVVLDEVLRFHGVGKWLMAISPTYWLAEGPGSRNYTDFGGSQGYVVVLAGYTAVSLFLLLFMARTFDRRMGRQS